MALLENYVAAGFDPAAFWGLSPRLYVAHMAGAQRRAEMAHNDAMRLAYTTAVLTRVKTMPKLEKLMVRKVKHQRRQSREELQAMCNALAIAWGAKKG